jgi:hypothetical protein
MWSWEPHLCTEGSVLPATVESSLKVRAAANQCRMLHPIAKYSIPLLDHNKPSRQESLQVVADSVGTRINPDIVVIFLNGFRPAFANYSGQS